MSYPHFLAKRRETLLPFTTYNEQYPRKSRYSPRMYGVINRIVPIVLFTMTEPLIRTKKEDFWLHPRSTNLLLFFLLTKSYPHIHTAYYYEIPFFLLHNIVS